ncbi:MAG: tetratricopeptide repeat protein [Pseudomonadota bacterium]
MRQRLRHKHSVASAFAVALIFAPGTGWAQVTPPEAQEEEASEPAEQAPAPDVTTQDLSEAELRQRHLNELFMRLAEAEASDWPQVQSQIWAAWGRSGSASMDLLLQRASWAMQDQDYKTALIHLDDLVRLAPEFAEGWNRRATVYFLQGNYGASVADIQRTLALEPRHFGALSGLGIILDRLGDKKGALRAYRRAVEIHPNMEGAQEAIERLAPDVDGREL